MGCVPSHLKCISECKYVERCANWMCDWLLARSHYFYLSVENMEKAVAVAAVSCCFHDLRAGPAMGWRQLVICSRLSFFSYTSKLNHVVPVADGQIVHRPRWFMSAAFSDVSYSTTGSLWGLFAIYSHRNKRLGMTDFPLAVLWNSIPSSVYVCLLQIQMWYCEVNHTSLKVRNYLPWLRQI